MNEAASPPSLILVHLSDIHFHKPATNGQFTPDDDIRHEMKRDIPATLEQYKLGPAHFVLVTGDVAFSGDKDEFTRSETWLREVCEKAKCPAESVRSIPGNHDVRRSVTDSSIALQDAHKALRTEPSNKAEGRLNQYLQDKAASNLLFLPLDNYNNFAAKFGCTFNSSQPYWEHDVLLNDRSTLRIRGLHSALISDKLDDKSANRLVVGANNCVLRKDEGVEYLVLCHHPPTWLYDGEEVEGRWNSRARILLFGHKHVQYIDRKISAAGHQSLRIHAGAVNPDPGEDEYLPRYNILAISVIDKEGGRFMRVAVHRRVWDSSENCFTDPADASGGGCVPFELPIPSWKPTDAPLEVIVPQVELEKEPLQIVSDPLKLIPDGPTRTQMDARRRLAYRFLALPYHSRMEVAQQLALLRDEDQDVAEPELSRRFFRRAKEKDLMPELWRKVEEKHGEPATAANPFQG